MNAQTGVLQPDSVSNQICRLNPWESDSVSEPQTQRPIIFRGCSTYLVSIICTDSFRLKLIVKPTSFRLKLPSITRLEEYIQSTINQTQRPITFRGCSTYLVSIICTNSFRLKLIVKPTSVRLKLPSITRLEEYIQSTINQTQRPIRFRVGSTYLVSIIRTNPNQSPRLKLIIEPTSCRLQLPSITRQEKYTQSTINQTQAQPPRIRLSLPELYSVYKQPESVPVSENNTQFTINQNHIQSAIIILSLQ